MPAQKFIVKITSPKKSFWLVLKRPGSLDTFNVAKTGNLIASIDLPEHNHTTLVNINIGISIDTNITTMKTVRNMATRSIFWKLHNLHGNEVDISCLILIAGLRCWPAPNSKPNCVIREIYSYSIYEFLVDRLSYVIEKFVFKPSMNTGCIFDFPKPLESLSLSGFSTQTISNEVFANINTRSGHQVLSLRNPSSETFCSHQPQVVIRILKAL